MAVLETVVRHASDWIDWIDRSGYAAPDHLPRADALLQVALETAPADLSLYHKPGQSVLWRSRTDLLYVIAGAATPADLAHPAEAGYPISGRVRDPAGRYNPRRFTLTAGNASGHAIGLFRSPLGTRFASAGGLRARLAFADGRSAAWAIVAVTVTPPVGPALPFIAQADGQGEVALPLSRLPALTKDAPSSTYPATLGVRALPGLTGADVADPDGLPAVRVGDPTSGNLVSTAALAIEPGRIATVASQGEDHLVLEET